MMILFTAGHAQDESFNDWLRAAAAVGQCQRRFIADALVRIGAQRRDERRFRFGPVAAIDRAEIADRGAALLGLGFALLDAGGGAFGAVGRGSQVLRARSGWTAAADEAAAEQADRR